MRFNKCSTYVIYLLCFVAFSYITIENVFKTFYMNYEALYSEKVEGLILKYDIIIVNILFTLIYIFIYINLSNIKLNVLYLTMIICIIALGIYWVISVQHIPGADSANIFETATEVIKGDYSSFFDGGNFYDSHIYKGVSYYNIYILSN